MEKTIEERKKECATKYYEEYHDSTIAVGIEKGYEIGATEQEEITRKEMIEKACKYLRMNLTSADYTSVFIIMFRKAMEE